MPHFVAQSLVLVFAIIALVACESEPKLREWSPADHAYPPGLTNTRAAPGAQPSPEPVPTAKPDAAAEAPDGGTL